MNCIDFQEWRRLLEFLAKQKESFYYPYRVPGGLMYLDITESPMMLQRVLGQYEVARHRALTNLLREGDVMIDVGANKGDFSLLAAKCVGITGEVLAFEPEPSNCEWLHRSVKLNGYPNLKIFQAALSDRNGKTELFIAQRSGWHSLKGDRNSNQSRIPVDQVRLDDFLQQREFHRPIRCIKIDVEGAELEVLHGASETLRNNDVTLLLDVHPHLGVDVGEVVEFLNRWGFALFNEKDSSGEPITEFQGVNSFLAKKV